MSLYSEKIQIIFNGYSLVVTLPVAKRCRYNFSSEEEFIHLKTYTCITEAICECLVQLK